MEKEHKILTYIQHKDNATQRDIATHTGIGLGTVNLLLKKMIKTGLVKIERLNAKSLRYILTPKGLKEKTQRTYNYIKHSYNHITTVTQAVEALLKSSDFQKSQKVYLYGPKNEMYQIINLALQKQKGIKYTHITDKEPPPTTTSDIILIWRLEEEESLSNNHKTINILSKL